jgi:urea transport system substrate-binding protein
MQADLDAVALTLSGRTRTLTLPSQSQLLQKKPPSKLTSALFLGGVLFMAGLVALLIAKPWRSDAPALPAEPPKWIHVGVLHSLTGPMAASTSPVVDATLMAIEEINAAGGLLGATICTFVVDGQNDPDLFAREAERLIAQEKASAVFGCWTSAARKTVKPVFEKHNHLLLYPVQYEGLESSPNIFYFGAAPNQQIIPAVEWAVKTLGKKSFFLVGSDYIFPHAANEIIKDQLKLLGGTIAGEMYLGVDYPETAAVCSAIAKARPDMILNTINGDANIEFFRNLRRAGVASEQTPTLSFSIGEQGLRALSAKDIAGDYTAWTYYTAIDTPQNAEFVRRVQAKYPARGITDPMEAAYVSVKMWANAVTEAGSVDPKAVRRALLNQSLMAPSGEVRVDSDTQHVWKTPRIGQVQANGKMKIVMTAPEPVEPDPFPATRKASEWNILLNDLHRQWGGRWSGPEK